MDALVAKYKLALKLADELEQADPESLADIKDVLMLTEELFKVKFSRLPQ